MKIISKTWTLIGSRCNFQYFQRASVRPRSSRNGIIAGLTSAFRNSRPWPLPKPASCVSEFFYLDSLLSTSYTSLCYKKYSLHTVYRETRDLARGHLCMGARGNIFNAILRRLTISYIFTACARKAVMLLKKSRLLSINLLSQVSLTFQFAPAELFSLLQLRTYFFFRFIIDTVYTQRITVYRKIWFANYDLY